MDAADCPSSHVDEADAGAGVTMEELVESRIKTEIMDYDHCAADFAESPQFFQNRSGHRLETEPITEEEVEFKRLMDKLADFQSETGSRGIVMSPAKFDAIIYNLKTPDAGGAPSRFQTWIMSRGFYLTDYPEHGLKDVLMKPARVDKKAISAEPAPPLTVIHSRDLYDVTKYVHSIIFDHGGYKRVLSYMQSKYFGVTRGYVQQFCLLCPYCRSKKRSHKALLAAATATHTTGGKNNPRHSGIVIDPANRTDDDDGGAPAAAEVVWETIYASPEEEMCPGPIDMTINNTQAAFIQDQPTTLTAYAASSSPPFPSPFVSSAPLYRHPGPVTPTSFPIPNAVVSARGVGGGRGRGRGRGRVRGRGRARGNVVSSPSWQQQQHPVQRMEVRLNALKVEPDTDGVGTVVDGGRVYTFTLKDIYGDGDKRDEAEERTDENDDNNRSDINDDSGADDGGRGETATDPTPVTSPDSTRQAKESASRGSNGHHRRAVSGDCSRTGDVDGGDGDGAGVVSLAAGRPTEGGLCRTWSKNERKAATFPAASGLTMERLKRRISASGSATTAAVDNNPALNATGSAFCPDRSGSNHSGPDGHGQRRHDAGEGSGADEDDDDTDDIQGGERKRRSEDQLQQPLHPPQLHPQRPPPPPYPSSELQRPHPLTPPPPSLSPQAERRESGQSYEGDDEIHIHFCQAGDWTPRNENRVTALSSPSLLPSALRRKRMLRESLQPEKPTNEAKPTSLLPSPHREAHRASLSAVTEAEVKPQAKRVTGPGAAPKWKRKSAVSATHPSGSTAESEAASQSSSAAGPPTKKAATNNGSPTSAASFTPTPPPTPNPVPLLKPKPAPVSGSPFFSRVHVDIIDMTQTPNRPFFFIGHVTDLTRKLHVLFPLQEASPAFVAAVLDQRVLAYYGLPLTIRSNLGHAFVERLIRALAEIVEGGVSCLNGEPPPKTETEVAESADGGVGALEAMGGGDEAGRTNVVEELIAMLSVERRGSNIGVGGDRPVDNVPWLLWLPRIMRSLNRDWHAFLRTNPTAAFQR